MLAKIGAAARIRPKARRQAAHGGAFELTHR